MNNTHNHIVITSVADVRPADSKNTYQMDLNFEVNGITRVVSIGVSKYEKRHAYNVRNARDLIGFDSILEEKVRTAAVMAFAGELKTPIHIC